MAKGKTNRLSEDVLAEQWYSFLHQLIGRMQEAFRTARRVDSELSQKTIAEKLGKPAPFISRCLSGQQNMTIRTIYYIARAMGYRLEITFRPLKSIQPSNFDASDLAERTIATTPQTRSHDLLQSPTRADYCAMKKGYKVKSIIICDDVRTENSGKEILIGVYNDVIVFPRLPAGIIKLFIRVALDVIPLQSFTFNILIVDPDGKTIGEHERKAEAPDVDTPVLIGLVLAGLRFEKEGIYKIRLRIDGSKLEEIGSFAVRTPRNEQEKEVLDALTLK